MNILGGADKQKRGAFNCVSLLYDIFVSPPQLTGSGMGGRRQTVSHWIARGKHKIRALYTTINANVIKIKPSMPKLTNRKKWF